MGERILQPSFEGDEPQKPKESLPSYDEPTPETRRKISREEEAEFALKSTAFRPGARSLLIALFIVTICSVPVLQLMTEFCALRSGRSLPLFDVFRVFPSWEKICTVRSASDVWGLLPAADKIKAAEKTLESQSVLSQWLLPYTQALLTGKLRVGNQEAYVGRNGWLFYRDDVDYITGPPFLDPARIWQREREHGVEPDPVKCIIDFRNQLAAREIDLIVIPAPVKPCVDGAMLSERAAHEGVLQNASFSEFKRRLERANVRVFDPAPLLMERRQDAQGAPLYLETDTHWRPETMEYAAQRLAAFISARPGELTRAFHVTQMKIAAYGDIFTMLRLPAGQKIYDPQEITISQVLVGNAFWRPNKTADMLLLGDSFSNIFSLEPMGWGESAGFAEQLSRTLGGKSLDCILRNSDGAYATREILSRELAHGRDRLAGKKLVLWEFAVRELAFGNWKLIAMKNGQPQEARYINLKPGEEVTVTGTVEAVSPVPVPGSVPYKDHILALHLAEITGLGQGQRTTESLQALLYMWSMRDGTWTPAARLRIGDRVAVRLRPWVDVSDLYEKINRTELDDPSLQLDEPVWGELA